VTTKANNFLERPPRWPNRADPPMRYWGNYRLYQARGRLVHLEEDIRGIVADNPGYGDISRFYFFCTAFDQLIKEGIRADIAELGVYKGETASVLARMARRMNTTAWILDTYEGFNQQDLQGIDANHQMAFSDTSLEAVRARVGEENVRFVKGYFPDSASEIPTDRTFALVHIDCDLYRPVTHALNYFYPRLVPGGYLIIHDYGSFAWNGAENAVDEFFADKPEAVIPLTDGCTSCVIRKARIGNANTNWLMRKRCSLLTYDWIRIRREINAPCQWKLCRSMA
jgi:Macrocin-O-methyltransferase (TylF)